MSNPSGALFEEIQWANFRNLAPASLEFSSLNIFVGKNGAGKTSALEAILFFGALKSFRQGRSMEHLIQHQTPYFLLRYHTKDNLFAAQKFRGSPLVLRVDEESHSAASWLRLAPATFIFTPHVDNLLSAEASMRRRFYDLLMFHMKPSFYDTWQFYEKALENRNAGLKQKSLSDDLFWRGMVARYGELLTQQRQSVFEAWKHRFQALLASLVGDEAWVDDLSVRFFAGYSEQSGLLASLEAHASRDATLGYTQKGAHRFDLLFSLGGQNAAYVLSRGQLKRVHLCALMASLESIAPLKPSMFLLDDLASELDQAAQRWLWAKVQGLSVQVFLSSLNTHEAQQYAQNAKDASLFMLEKGHIQT